MRQEYLAYLKSALPEADKIERSDEALLKVIDHAVSVREITPWGKKIPENVFRAFVLFPRVNNEKNVFYHEVIWNELKDRILDKSMTDAVLEVNLWSCERATYQSTDDRTADALTVLRRTFGRCGEESTLLVSTLRACGIPARQVYAPRWSHCEDNHAWVEVWVDGEWRYFGACEPEPVLDSGWFTAAASKAMLVHTRAYGVAPEGDYIEQQIGQAYVINRTAAYAKTKLLTLRVTENGLPKAASVRFEIANMGELFPINEQQTDENGVITFLTGLGTLHLHVHDGERYLCLTVDVMKSDSVEIDFGEAVEFDGEVSLFGQISPLESRIQPAEFTEEVAQAHERKLARCEELRAAIIASFRKDDEILARSLGNHGEIEKFLADERFDMQDKRALLSTLTYKDLGDVTYDVLVDAVTGALPFKGDYPENIWRESVLCPRVWNEPLTPCRAEFAGMEKDALRLWETLSAKTERVEMDPPTLTPDVRAVLRSGRASDLVFDVFYVAAARAQGIAARLNPASAQVEIWEDGAYRALIPAREADAKLVLVEKSGRELIYGAHFTVGVLENGAFRTLSMNGTVLKDRLEIPVFAGRYRVTTCFRQIDGNIDGALFPAEIASGETKEIEVFLREDRTADKLMQVELPKLPAGETLLPGEGDAIIALIAPGQEPTEHFLNELLDAKDELKNRGIGVELVIDRAEQAENPKLKLVMDELAEVRLHVGSELSTVLEWRRLLNAGELRLPLAVAVTDGKGQHAFINYNVGSVLALVQVILAARG